VGFLGSGAASPPPYQLGGLGERCKLTQWCPGQSPGQNRFLFVFNPTKSTWGITALDGKNSGEARSIARLRAFNSEEARAASVPHRLRCLCSRPRCLSVLQLSKWEKIGEAHRLLLYNILSV